jgi:hypothetical protein
MKNDETSAPNIPNENKGVRNNENAAILKNQRKAKNDGLAVGIVTTAFIAVIILIAAAIYGNSMINREQEKQVSMLESQKQSFTEFLTTRDSIINESILTFDQIEKDLNTIKEKENLITIQSSDKEFSKNRKQQILQDISFINSLLDRNKKKIASLTAQLKNSGGAIKGLQLKIAELEAYMKLREGEISDLKVALVKKEFEIGQLNSRLTDQQIAIAQKDEQINWQTSERDKAYLASGTYKDLKTKGLISKGGFLGFGKKESLQADFADSSFTQISISEMRAIPVNSRVAKLITEHPRSSYEMKRGSDNKISSIEIKDPDQFWKISRYAIVEIRN